MIKVRHLIASGIAGLVVSIATLAADANVAGTWTMSSETPQGTRQSTLTLVQQGSTLTGTIKGARGENPITGTVSGNEVKFSYTLSMGGNEIKIDYAGTVDGSSMSGTAKNPRGESKFTATKQ
ncbi:MAG TPA: hypothetical protein VET48_05665 [Steroidobacteraceae bacterium]|nr:hypothetical protein [Steroidobacteraceae bacterium]